MWVSLSPVNLLLSMKTSVNAINWLLLPTNMRVALGNLLPWGHESMGRALRSMYKNDWGPVELEQTITVVFLSILPNPLKNILMIHDRKQSIWQNPDQESTYNQSIWIYLETTLPCNNKTYFCLIVYHIVCFQRLLNMPVQSPLYRWVKQCRRSPKTWTPIHTEFHWVSAQESHRMLMIMMWLDLSSEHWILMAGKNLEKFLEMERVHY